jgi:hypothetical protein
MDVLIVLVIIAVLVAGLYAVFCWGFKEGARASNCCEDCVQWTERMQKPAPLEEFK